jgi:NADPH:quinone reductase-like Zn-dependent oxidoreductase
MTPITATALVTKGGKLSKEAIPVPTPGEHQVLVKVSHVAQNPTDGKSCLHPSIL